ncbi:MAG TPA: transglycosylase SLT domain-containing protein [Casimicrobiaceae bacterium]|nr:transglycosylase SLT domain-containing protein [Casimicrobiaceae bacterium]
MRSLLILQAGVRVATLLVALVAAPALSQPGDSDFLAARDAFRAGDSARLDRVAPRLKGHLLEPYVAYWRMRLRLDDADSERVQAFLARYDGMPLADRLRSEWLKSLAKREQWPLFAVEYPRRAGDDAELDCYALQWKRARDGDVVFDEAMPYWLSGQDQPESCQALFTAMLKAGRLSPQDIWDRFRLAHEAGNYPLAAKLVAELPSGDRPAPRDLERVEHNAAQALANGDFRLSSRSGRELLLYAADRASRSDAASAHEAWLKRRDRLGEADRAYGNLLVAYSAARQLNPAANDWYRDAEAAPQNTEQRAWRVRAALRAGAWPDVARAIDAMPDAQAQEAAWRYWKARAVAATGQKDDATQLFGALATEQHFYGLLAAEAIGAAIMPVSEPLQVDPAALAAFGARDAVQRVVKLTAFDLRPEALREWLYVVRGQGDDALLLAAEFARRNGLYDRSINTAERTQRRHDFALRYQTPYDKEIGEAAREAHLDEAWVFGVARQESRFIADIVSSAGAVGLMQLMPSTAKWVARKTGRPTFRRADLDLPSVNAQFGTFYLRYVLERLDNLPVLATAAYNAGPGRAQAWRGATSLEGAIYAETIPLTETRDYVKKVLANAMFYQAQLGLPYVALKDRLGIVTPDGRNGTASLPAANRPSDTQ